MLLSELIAHFSLTTATPLTSDFEVRGVRPLSLAGEGELSFLSNPKYRAQVAATKASAILVKTPLEEATAVQIICADPYATLASVLALLYPEPLDAPGIHASAVVASDAEIDASAYIGPHCVVESGAKIAAGCQLKARVCVGKNASLGEGCQLFPGVVLYAGVTLGRGVRVHANTVIGSDGFGYAQTAEGHLKVPQIGSVVIGDGVEIGAGTCIDRGALDDTTIGAGTIIDNQVQIAHGVKIGKASIIVAQSGISGSAQIGNGSVLAGKVGVVGHVTVGDGVMVMGDSVVTKNLEKPGRYAGNPAIPHIQYQRQKAHQRMLPELKKRVSQLEARLGKDE